MNNQAPIERAVKHCETLTASDVAKHQSFLHMNIHEAFESIDTNQLAHVVFSTPHGGDGEAASDIALAVKNWLTGKEEA